MCGRFALAPNQNSLSKYYNLPIDLKVDPDYNITPSQQVPIIIMKDKLEMEFMQWGFIPFWAKDPKIAFKMINARAEDIEDKPSFERNLISKRCIIPASGFYEWKKEGKSKTPFYFQLKDRDIFSFAGLFDVWKNDKGEFIKTFTIITTEANSLVKEIHDRMPVILKPEDELRWLDTDLKDVEEIKAMLKPYNANEMKTYRVSNEINFTKVNDSKLINPI